MQAEARPQLPHETQVRAWLTFCLLHESGVGSKFQHRGGVSGGCSCQHRGLINLGSLTSPITYRLSGAGVSPRDC